MQDIKKINYKMFTPCPQLKDFVQAIWFVENKNNTQPLPFKILTDCGSGIVFNFGGKINTIQNDHTLDIYKDCITAGPSQHLLTMTFHDTVCCIGIRFFPATGHHFFKCTMDQLTDKIQISTPEQFDGAANLYSQIRKSLDASAGHAEIIKLIESHLIEVLKNSKTQPQSLLINILKAIHQKQEITLPQISDKFNISPRDIQRLFKTYVGVTPKIYIRLNKIKNAKTKIANDEFQSLTQLSLDAGYFDQAHFIRDFKAFMQDTPKKYHTYKKQQKRKK